ncbi:hypothetical protein LAh8_23 [Aeromonas phage LAh_8]|uniref:Uncharacterized protein n=1 Tax=Aeromonas phage LAh_8 TaxID=2591032 RepID=A0A514A0H8_9CAUD|nr:hypothetical protein HWC31_gp023 [Aeromonas phage LAh_8]QDH46756.1 hypothetical protein LAh8_23 [Aeromonas phage LAh_8]
MTEKDMFYEIHVTVKCPRYEIPRFEKICKILNVKPIVIVLEKGSEEVMQDVMTSSKVDVASVAEAVKMSMDIENKLKYHRFRVVRRKVETMPIHPLAPQFEGDPMPVNCYFESHIQVVVERDGQKNLLDHIAKESKAHKSRNAFKKMLDGSYIQMLTLRDHNTNKTSFSEAVASLRGSLEFAGFTLGKMEVEFAIFDTNVHHDKVWTG